MHDGPGPHARLQLLVAFQHCSWTKAALLLARVPRRLSVNPSLKLSLAIAQGVSGLSP